MFKFIKTAKSLAINIFGKPFNLTASNANWDTVNDAIHRKDWDKVENLVAPGPAIERFTNDEVKVTHGQLTYKGMEMDGNVVARRILELKAAGEPFEPLAKFLDKVQSNPAPWAIDEIWLFMESGRLPLCADGDFLAFKYVRDDYKDCYTGTFDNSVGQIVTMNRGSVNTNRHQTCASGLHFCSRKYLGNHDRIMVLKINPADVVSIPSDYSNQKGRTWRYEVVGEIGKNVTYEDMETLIHHVRPLEPETVGVTLEEPVAAIDLDEEPQDVAEADPEPPVMTMSAGDDDPIVEIIPGDVVVTSGTVIAQIVTTDTVDTKTGKGMTLEQRRALAASKGKKPGKDAAYRARKKAAREEALAATATALEAQAQEVRDLTKPKRVRKAKPPVQQLVVVKKRGRPAKAKK